MVALAIAGVAIAGYLTLVHSRHSLLVCSGVSDCETVQTSQYAEILGIPVALMGHAGILVLLMPALVRFLKPDSCEPATLTSFRILAG